MSTSSSLRNKATSGFIWSALQRFSVQGVAFVVQLILARILEPAQFGLVAMVAVFAVVSQVLVEAGLGASIIQRDKLTHKELCTVFFLNQFISIGVVGLLWVIAPFIGEFYRQPELVPILRVLGIGVALGATGSIHGAILQRDLRFKTLFWVSTPASLVSGAIGIGMAVWGFGVWALVGQTLIRQAMTSVMYWYQSSWRPSWLFSWSSLKELLPYGARLAGASVLNEGFRDIYVLVIGRMFSPLEVGYFQRAQQLSNYPVSNLQAVLERVMFPVLASIQDQRQRMQSVLSKSIQLGALLAFPGMAFLGSMAHPLIIFLIGAKWSPIAPVFQLLCISGALYPIHASNLSLLKAAGRSDLYLRLEIIKKALILCNVLITVHIGIMAMAVGIVVSSILALGINTYYTRKLVDYGLIRQLRDIGPIVALGAVIWGVGLGISHTSTLAPWLTLCIGGVAVWVIALLVMRFMPAATRHEFRTLAQRFPKAGKYVAILLGPAPRSSN